MWEEHGFRFINIERRTEDHDELERGYLGCERGGLVSTFKVIRGFCTLIWISQPGTRSFKSVSANGFKAIVCD